MSSTPFRFIQRRTLTSGKVPTLSTLLTGEIYLQAADGTIYFRDAYQEKLHTVITDASGFGLNKIKFSGASSGQFPLWDGDKFIPYGTGSFVTTGQTGSFGSSVVNNSTIYLDSGYGLNSIQQINSNNISSGKYSLSIGSGNLAEKDFSFALGQQAKTTQYGEFAFSNGNFDEQGDSQYSMLMARGTSKNASPIKLKIDDSDKIVEFDLGSTAFFTVNVVGAGDTQFISNEIRGIARRSIAQGSQISFLNSPSKSVYAHSNSSYSIDVILSTSDNSLKIECVGNADEEMNWFAKIDLIKIKKQRSKKVYFNSAQSLDWFNINNWFFDKAFSQKTNSFPSNQSEVYIYNTNNSFGNELPFVNIDNQDWVTPALINTQNISNTSGLKMTSDVGAEFTGIIIGPVTFSGVNPVTVTNNLYFSGVSNNDWFSSQNWFITSSFKTKAPSIPKAINSAYMYGSDSACVNIDNPSWITPQLINTQNVSDPSGIYIISTTGKKFTGTIVGTSTFSGASPN